MKAFICSFYGLAINWILPTGDQFGLFLGPIWKKSQTSIHRFLAQELV